MGSLTSRMTPGLPFLVETLPGWPDVSLLRAAARAGAAAIVNLEGVAASEVRSRLAALTRDEAGRIGVRIDAAATLEPLWDLLDAIHVVVVATGALSETIDLIDRLRAPSRQVLLE